MNATTPMSAAPSGAAKHSKRNDAPRPVIDTAAIAQALESGETLTITVKGDQIEAKKTGGPDRFSARVDSTAGTLAGGGSFLASLVNGGAGTDPTFTFLTAAQATNAALSNISLVPQTVSGFFSANFYPVFRMMAPLLDTIKLVNDLKANRAEARLKRKDGPESTESVKKPSVMRRMFSSVNLMVDAAHLALDVSMGALIGAYFLQAYVPGITIPTFVPPWLTMAVAGGIAYTGDVIAMLFHGTGSAASLSDPAHGSSFAARASRFMATTSVSAMVRRVFKGEEPLLDNTAVPPTKAPAPEVPETKTEVQP